MGDQDVTLTSTTDTAEQVQSALGVKEETKPAATEQKTEAAAEQKLSQTTADTDGIAATKTDAAEAAAAEVTEPTEEEKAATAATEEKRKKAAQAGGQAKSRLDKRIKDLVDERNATRGELEATKAEADALRKRVESIIAGKAEATAEADEAKGKQAQTPPRPKAEDYPDYDEYLTARDEWVMARAQEASKAEVDAAVKEALKQRDTAAQTAAQQRAQEEAQQRYQKSVENAMARYEDFEEVVNKPTKLTRVMFDGMLDSDVGAEVAYYLSKNDDARKKLFDLGETAKAIKEFGKIEALVERQLAEAPVTGAADDEAVDDGSGDEADEADAEAHVEPETQRAAKPAAKATETPKPAKKVATKAPEPMPKTSGGTGAVSTVPLDQLSFSEYRATRMKQIKESGRRL